MVDGHIWMRVEINTAVYQICWIWVFRHRSVK